MVRLLSCAIPLALLVFPMLAWGQVKAVEYQTPPRFGIGLHTLMALPVGGTFVGTNQALGDTIGPGVGAGLSFRFLPIPEQRMNLTVSLVEHPLTGNDTLTLRVLPITLGFDYAFTTWRLKPLAGIESGLAFVRLARKGAGLNGRDWPGGPMYFTLAVAGGALLTVTDHLSADLLVRYRVIYTRDTAQLPEIQAGLLPITLGLNWTF